MRIIDQTKTIDFNYDIAEYIKMQKLDKEDKEYFSVINDYAILACIRDKSILLGAYRTEEKAMTVLNAINSMYQANEMFKCVDFKCQEKFLDRLKEVGQEPFIYKMPEM